MLNIVNVKPDFFLDDVDAVWRNASLKDYQQVLQEVLLLNNSQLFSSDALLKYPDLPMSQLPIVTPYGVTTASHISSSTKALGIAKVSKLNNIPFCCYEFVIGPDIIPLFVDLAQDCDLIFLYSADLRLSIRRKNYSVFNVLVNGKKAQIKC